MGKVTVRLNGQTYQLACRDGEEKRLESLAAYVDEKMTGLAATLGQAGDSRLFLMAALVIADELAECRERLGEGGGGLISEAWHGVLPAATAPDATSERIAELTSRLEHIAARLEKA